MALTNKANQVARKNARRFLASRLSPILFLSYDALHKIQCRWLAKSRRKKLRKVQTTTACVVVFLFSSLTAQASTPEYFNKVVNAIYLAEGGDRAKVPYGILSVKVSSKEEARRVCFNTVRNNWKRWNDAGHPGDFISFLASRYCPVGVGNDPGNLNRNWIKNVKALLKKETANVSR